MHTGTDTGVLGVWPWRVFRVLDAPVLRTSDDFLALVDLADADMSLGPHKERAAAKKARQAT